jgi:hypothetical protein
MSKKTQIIEWADSMELISCAPELLMGVDGRPFGAVSWVLLIAVSD